MNLFRRKARPQAGEAAPENTNAKNSKKKISALWTSADSPKAKGYAGEDMATAELLQRGYRILDRNYTTGYGEIDIVAEKDDVIYFVEVKTRDVHNYFFPSTSITDNKRYKIAGVAKHWFATHGGERAACLLVAEVYMDNGEIILFQDFLL